MIKNVDFHLPGGRSGVLLIHGLTGTPTEMRFIAKGLNRNGFTVHGMQLAGQHFTNETALAGNDLSTLPDFPAEIRAPAGTLAGVSGFQLHFSSRDVFTPGDAPDVLVAMNPAALKSELHRLDTGGAPNGELSLLVTPFSPSPR